MFYSTCIFIYTHSNKHVINKGGFYNLELIFYLDIKRDIVIESKTVTSDESIYPGDPIYQGDIVIKVTYMPRWPGC